MINSDWLKIKEVFSQTLDLPEAERARFLENYEENVRLEVGKLLKFHAEADEFIEQPFVIENNLTNDAFAENLIGKKINDYEILEKIGEGGMGTVFLAERAERDFSQKVALKIIKRGMDTNAVLKRFLMERQILASLENPFIARLLDGGTTADGLPFFVMEYVEGENVRDFCDARECDTRQRLEIFLKVCEAVAYAHQKLVVHRDLKPSNIIVTPDGTPKLLDFGIAKLLNPDWNASTAEATAMQMRLFTPEYASPEQLAGKATTTTSDVYSLGVVLYELLAGTRPYNFKSQNSSEILPAIFTNEPLRPSLAATNSKFKAQTAADSEQRTTNSEQNFKSRITNPKSLKGDLDNIILKAISRESARRYQSVQEFAEDIRRHLSGLPVSATAPTRLYRFSKFFQRYRQGAIAGFLVGLLILSAAGIAIWQGILANRERAKAERRFEQVRKLANTVLFEYHDGIANLPGATPMREKMVKDSLEFLDNLAAESDGNTDLQREIVKAFQKVGDIQGASSTGNIGKTQAALESYQKALAIQEKIAAAHADSAEDQSVFGKLLIDIGLQQRETGDLQSAEKSFLNALEIFEKLPDDVKKQSSLAKAFWNIASLQTAQNNLDASLENYQKAVEIYESLAVSDSANKLHRRNAALTHKNIGSVLQLHGETEKALTHFRKSLAIDLENARSNPNDISAQLDLSFTYGTLASALRDAKNFADSMENTRLAIEIREKVFDADPKNAFAENAVARGYQELGRTFLAQQKYAEAEKEFAKAQTIYQKMADSDAESSVKKNRLAESLALLGYVHGLTGRLSKAREFYESSLGIYVSLKNLEKLSTFEQRRFAAAYLGFGEVLLKNKQSAQALENLQKARELLENEKVKKDAAEEIKQLNRLLNEFSK